MSVNQNSMVNPKPLHSMFTDIPPRYDLINTLITWGMDRGWRRRAVLACLQSRPSRVLDLCCGTGDLGIMIASRADYPLEIKGLDYSQPMLDIAAHKAETAGVKNIAFHQGDASKMPFEASYFDCIGVSFAFRNLTYKNPLAKAHLAEILRVLKPGGRCVIAESSQPRNGFIRSLNHFYMRQYAARLGGLLSGNKSAYRYLGESTSRYYSPSEMKELLISSGFSGFSYQPLFFGAAGVYIATK